MRGGWWVEVRGGWWVEVRGGWWVEVRGGWKIENIRLLLVQRVHQVFVPLSPVEGRKGDEAVNETSVA